MSIPLRLKVENASCGVFTIGSPPKIERRIEHHRNACGFTKGLDQPVVAGTQVPVYNLQAAGPIHMCHCWDVIGDVGSKTLYRSD